MMNAAAAGSNFGTAAGGTLLQSISGLIGSGGAPVPKPAAANRRPAASRPSNGAAAAAAEGVSSDSPIFVLALPCDDDSDSSGSSFT